MRSFFHNFFYHPTSSAWGIGAIVMGTIAAYRDDWSFALSFWTLGLQQMGSRDTDRTAERLPPPREDSGPSPLQAALKQLDPDALTPREALDALYTLKKLT